jgi:NitT/TauT family transport system substrate-binding protein
MHIALSRGDIDAVCRRRTRPRRVAVQRLRYAGRISLLDGDGDRSTWCSAPIRDVIAEKPDLVRVHARHSSARDRFRVDRTRTPWSQWRPASSARKREAIEASVPNVELTWKLEAKQIEQSKIYADHMLALKQIKRPARFRNLHRHQLLSMR